MSRYMTGIKTALNEFQEEIFRMSEDLIFVKKMKMNFMLDRFNNLTFVWCDSIRVEKKNRDEMMDSILERKYALFSLGSKSRDHSHSKVFSNGSLKYDSNFEPLKLENTFEVKNFIRHDETCYFCGNNDYLYDLKVEKADECQKYDFFRRKPKLKKSIIKRERLKRSFKICEDCTKIKGIIMKDQDYKLTDDLIKAEVDNVLIPKIVSKYSQKLKFDDMYTLFKRDQAKDLKR